ncbi:MAG: contractile tail tube protein [Rickettsiaceae bacterium]|jgi:P2 family phage contractile tail tube protein|nr:contractile tail tube protein [Rickettsiaceae bacterium]
MIPKILKNFNAFVDGRGYAGRVDEIVLPKLTVKTEEHRAGGMDVPVEIDMGMEKLEAEITFAEYDAQLFRLFGLTDGNAVSLTLRGAIQADGEAEPIVINLRGSFRELDAGTWKAGDKATLKCMVAVRYYRLTVSGDSVIEIDAENMIRIIGGEDQMVSIRQAIGI